MNNRIPYLEQRIALARRMLNLESLEFADHLPEKQRDVFHQYILDTISVLDGYSRIHSVECLAECRHTPIQPSECFSFRLDEDESRQAREFMDKHTPICPNRGLYQGAIGVGYGFDFGDTSIGLMCVVRCHCGASQHVTNN